LSCPKPYTNLPSDQRERGSSRRGLDHEIKYDGYRVIVSREGKTVRLFTKNGHDWSKRYPWLMETALKMKQNHFVIDGEVVVVGVNGVSDFDALHSLQHDGEVQLDACRGVVRIPKFGYVPFRTLIKVFPILPCTPRTETDVQDTTVPLVLKFATTIPHFVS
jgi:anaerobic glycerol-3-phosphate dehydrogenase